MAQNANLSNALKNLTFSDEGITALDELLKADPANPADFRQAVIDQKAFWQTQKVKFEEHENPDDNSFLYSGYNNLPILYKQAIQKRISLGLQNAEEARLRGLVGETDYDVFRQVLATPEFGAAVQHDDFIKQAREQALLGFAKAKLNKLSIELLSALVNAGSDDVKNTIKTGLLNGSSDADDLFGDDVDADTLKQLRSYAAVELLVKSIKERIAANEYDRIASELNDLSILEEPFKNLIASLSEDEQKALQIRMVEALVSNYPASQVWDDLAALAQANDEDSFRAALGRLDIKNQAWVSRNTKASVQDLAAQQAIALKVCEFSLYGQGKHPNLLAFIEKLPLTSQRALIADPERIKGLMQAQGRGEVEKILGSGSAAAHVDGLIAENKRLTALMRLNNAELAQIFADAPDTTIDKKQIKVLNAKLISPDAQFEEILRIIPVLLADEQTERIKEQHSFNKEIIDLIRSASTPGEFDKSIQAFCLSLRKAKEFPGKCLSGFSACFETAKNYQDAVARLELWNESNNEVFTDSWKKQFTPLIFNELQQKMKQDDVLAFGEKAESFKSAKESLAPLKKNFEALRKKDSGVRDELERVAHWTAIDWLNPAFQATAKQHAKEMKVHFEQISAACDMILPQYRYYQEELENQLASLPAQDDIADLSWWDIQLPINNARKEWTEQLEQVSQGIVLYEGLQNILKGKPDSGNALLEAGVLQALKDCEEGKKDVYFTHFDAAIENFPLEEKAERMKVKAGSEATIDSDGRLRAISGTKPKFELMDAINPESQGRQYTLTDDTGLKGSFIEIQSPQHLKPVADKEGRVQYKPRMELILTEFPKDVPLDREARKAGINAEPLRLKTAMAFASTLVRGLSNADRKEKVLFNLKGSNPEELRYIWTLLMIIGKHDPYLKFGKDAIQINSFCGFDPKNELGTFWGFNKNSLGAWLEKSPEVQAMLADIKALNEAKFGTKETKKIARGQEKDTKKLSEFFKDHKSELEKIKANNEEIAAKRGNGIRTR